VSDLAKRPRWRKVIDGYRLPSSAMVRFLDELVAAHPVSSGVASSVSGWSDEANLRAVRGRGARPFD
jgi:hypothetical protein